MEDNSEKRLIKGRLFRIPQWMSFQVLVDFLTRLSYTFSPSDVFRGYYDAETAEKEAEELWREASQEKRRFDLHFFIVHDFLTEILPKFSEGFSGIKNVEVKGGFLRDWIAMFLSPEKPLIRVNDIDCNVYLEDLNKYDHSYLYNPFSVHFNVESFKTSIQTKLHEFLSRLGTNVWVECKEDVNAVECPGNYIWQCKQVVTVAFSVMKDGLEISSSIDFLIAPCSFMEKQKLDRYENGMCLSMSDLQTIENITDDFHSYEWRKFKQDSLLSKIKHVNHRSSSNGIKNNSLLMKCLRKREMDICTTELSEKVLRRVLAKSKEGWTLSIESMFYILSMCFCSLRRIGSNKNIYGESKIRIHHTEIFAKVIELIPKNSIQKPFVHYFFESRKTGRFFSKYFTESLECIYQIGFSEWRNEFEEFNVNSNLASERIAALEDIELQYLIRIDNLKLIVEKNNMSTKIRRQPQNEFTNFIMTKRNKIINHERKVTSSKIEVRKRERVVERIKRENQVSAKLDKKSSKNYRETRKDKKQHTREREKICLPQESLTIDGTKCIIPRGRLLIHQYRFPNIPSNQISPIHIHEYLC